MAIADYKDTIKDCVVLCVDDEEIVVEFLKDLLSPYFKAFITASNGKEGLDRFNEHRVDLVITDQVMPYMTGLEMVKAIRAINQKVPVVLLTGYSDTNVILDAINIGVTQFLPKPVKAEVVFQAVENAIQRVIVEQQRFLKQEAELLRFSQQYNTLQQKLAFKKQQFIIRNDFYYKMFTFHREGTHEDWLINIKYMPKDILSGDFYSIRKIDGDRVLLYISDATGHGLNAFSTAIIVTSFLNHSIDRAIEKGDFDFERLLKDFLSFSTKQLSRDDALCAVLVLINFKNDTLQFSNFGMPSMCIDLEGLGVFKIANNNLPIMRFTDTYELSSLEVRGLRRLLLHSDGFYGGEFINCLEEDFGSSPFKSCFFNRFIDRVREPEDDATFIFLRRLDYTPQYKQEFVIKSKLQEIEQIGEEIEAVFLQWGLAPISAIELINALTELLMNAYEHGSLNITYLKKNSLLKKGIYESYIKEAEKGVDKNIFVTLEMFKESQGSFVCVRVRDEGEGFDTSIIKDTVTDLEVYHYRGIKIVKGLVDEIYYNEKGNEALMIKEVAVTNPS